MSCNSKTLNKNKENCELIFLFNVSVKFIESKIVHTAHSESSFPWNFLLQVI